MCFCLAKILKIKLRRSQFENFPWGACPPDPLVHMLIHVLRMAWPLEFCFLPPPLGQALVQWPTKLAERSGHPTSADGAKCCAFHKLQLQLVQRSKGQVESLAKRKYVTQIPGAELPVQVKLLCMVQNDSCKGSKVQIVSFRSSSCAVVKKVDHRARQKGNIYRCILCEY